MGKNQVFPSKILCLALPKNSVAESCTVALFLGNEKVRISKGMYQGFPSKILCLTMPKIKISVGESFTVALVLGIENFWIGVGEYQDFLSKILCLTVPKTSIGNPLLLHYFPEQKNLDRRGSIKFFRRNFYVSQCGDFL